MRKTIILFALTIIALNLASALTVDVVESPVLAPGAEGLIRMEIENTLDDDVKDVSVSLNLNNLPFVAVGNSEDSVDEIEEGDEEDFTFRIKAANNIAPGDYSIPYTIKYEINNEEKSRTGTLGVSISGRTLLDYTISAENPVVAQQGTITLRIVNKEFGDAKFVLVKVFPSGFTLLSDSEVYIGNIDSDDFETATFDVLFTSEKPVFSAQIEYKDFNNEDKREIINLPVEVYSKEKALELGIIKQSYISFYIGGVIAIILLWILWRFWRKSSRMKKSQMNGG